MSFFQQNFIIFSTKNCGKFWIFFSNLKIQIFLKNLAKFFFFFNHKIENMTLEEKE
jgi:hypothetical protein